MAEPRRETSPQTRDLEDARVLVVEGRFYEDIADALLAGACRVIESSGAKSERITVPGALEIPPAIAIALDAAEQQGRPFDGVVALGCVIRGETSHFDIVAGESARALMQMSVERELPLGNGILTVENEAQAWARARPEQMDKGGAAAEAALTMIRLKRNAMQSHSDA